MTSTEFYAQLAIDVAAVPDVESLTDEQVAVAINARTITGTQPIPSSELIAWAAARGKLAGLQAGAVTPEHAAQNAAMAIVAMTQRSGDSFDSTNADHQTILGSLVSNGLLTTGEGDTDTASLAARYTTSTPYVPTIYRVAEITKHDFNHVRSL